MKLAIIDVLGLSYDGSTLEKRGLGGSESAVIRISRELAALGFEVTVYNDCISDDSTPGTYDGVYYRDLKWFETDELEYDVIISSRSVAPFATNELKDQFKSFVGLPDFTKIQNSKAHKVLWMHDTFCDGDNLIEPYILQGRLNEVFTLSDWHTSYVSNCDHGTRRNYDILKQHIFQTRNGIGAIPKTWVDITQKDPDLFVFNSSVTKGMVPLVEDIWPKIKANRPAAKLKIIGGYYRFREGSQPDAQELQWREMVAKHPDIEFTGIITQAEISDILTKATFLLYPAGFPETFGISTLEAIAHNVVPITCRFGALEETAFDLCSYKLPYPVEPNWSLPWLNKEDQVERFVDLALYAYDNKYLTQQKAYACNQIKGIETWDTIALQWKQHLFNKTDRYLPISDYKTVQKINHKVREVFGRTVFNAEELQQPKAIFERKIFVVTPVYNAENYIRDCILSVAAQDYDDYRMIVCDDCSTDNTYNVAVETIEGLPEDVRWKFQLYKNFENKGAVYNQYSIITDYNDEDSIFMLLDGDDSLINNPQIFNKYNSLYEEGVEFTYGSCWSMADDIPLIAQEYPPEVKENKTYRQYSFNWGMPYTHLRTFSSDLVKDLKHTDWLVDGNWPKAGGDTIVFYNLIEKANPNKLVAISDIVYKYNDKNPLNDFKINGEEQTRIANRVTNLGKVDNFSVIMPTMWRCKDLTLLQIKKVLDHPLVDDVRVINNDMSRTPQEELDMLMDDYGSRFLVTTPAHNIGVNPAWNYGVKMAEQDRVCIMNDDILFDTKIFDRLQGKLFPGSGPYGLLRGDPVLGQPPPTDYSINFMEYNPGQCIHCFGQLFFVYKPEWTDIPAELVINWGDDWVFFNNLEARGNPVNLIYNMEFMALDSLTVTDPSVSLVSPERFEKEKLWYTNYVNSFHSSKLNQNTDTQERLRNLADLDLLPHAHKNYLSHMKQSLNVEPKVIWDIGSSVLHWSKFARDRVWPDAKYWLFEAMDEVGGLYKEHNFNHHVIGRVLSDKTDEDVKFYQNLEHPAGNSIYKENSIHSINANFLFPEDSAVTKKTVKADDLRCDLPDLIKLDVQGSELKILRGAKSALAHAKDIIIEMQHVEYNVGAPMVNEVREFLEGEGFKLVAGPFDMGPVDGDYHFTRNVQFNQQDLKKRILIAIPTARYIESETFRSIYNLEIPDGYEVTFQYFYGYCRSQILNLICDWGKAFDYTILIKNKTIIQKNVIIDALKENKDLIFFDKNRSFIANNSIFSSFSVYPNFINANTENEEIDQFISNIRSRGASVGYLI